MAEAPHEPANLPPVYKRLAIASLVGIAALIAIGHGEEIADAFQSVAADVLLTDGITS